MYISRDEGHSLSSQLRVLLEASDELLPLLGMGARIPVILNIIQQLHMMEPITSQDDGSLGQGMLGYAVNMLRILQQILRSLATESPDPFQGFA